MSNLINPTIDQALTQTWSSMFVSLSQQKESLLTNLPAIKDISFQSYKHNVRRIGPVELEEITGRNPDAQYHDPAIDNRQMTKTSFGYAVMIDKKDVREAMADFRSPVYQEILHAFNRKKDEFLVQMATGNVQVGETGKTTSVSFENDGGITTDATSGLTYNIIKESMRKFINREVVIGSLQNSNVSAIISGTEWEDLLEEDKFINNNYTKQSPVDDGSITKIFGMNVVTVAGSETGYTKNNNPILKETGTTRECLMLAPESILFDADNIQFEWVENLENKYRSSGLKFSCDMSAMRIEGVKVQKIKTSF